MEEIKIGEYLRTKKGRIAKATTINNVRYTYCGARVRGKLELVGTERKVISGRYELEDIAKHSFNIIDLIEVGDYVNGHLVSRIDNNITVWLETETQLYCGIYEKDIKTIVTKEQMKSMEYEV